MVLGRIPLQTRKPCFTRRFVIESIISEGRNKKYEKICPESIDSMGRFGPSAMFAQNLLLNGDFEAGNPELLDFFFATPGRQSRSPGCPMSSPLIRRAPARRATRRNSGREFEFNDAGLCWGGQFYQAFNCTAGSMSFPLTSRPSILIIL